MTEKPQTMKALAIPGYGDLKQLTVMALPIPIPAAGEVRVRVYASALNPADFKVITGTVKFLHARNFPMIVGYDFSGTIEALGAGVTSWKVGDEVFGFLPYGFKNRRGTFAESLIARADEIAAKPAAVSHTLAAAAATTGLTALQSIRDLGRLPSSGGRVLVTGVSGGVGSLAVGIARRLGAGVTAVGSGGGLELAKKQGADRVIDRQVQDVRSLSERFDVILDAAAAYRWRAWKSLLKPGGTFVTTLPSLGLVGDWLASSVSSARVRVVMVKSRPADLRLVGEWLSSGLHVPLDSTISVTDVAAGLAHLQKGQVVGRVAVEVLNRFP